METSQTGSIAWILLPFLAALSNFVLKLLIEQNKDLINWIAQHTSPRLLLWFYIAQGLIAGGWPAWNLQGPNEPLYQKIISCLIGGIVGAAILIGTLLFLVRSWVNLQESIACRFRTNARS
jgi:hypothetical protein